MFKFPASLKACTNEQMPCLPLALLSKMPLPAASSRHPSASVTVANTGLLRSKRGRRPEMSKLRSNRFGFCSSRKPAATPCPICVLVHRREWRARCLALFVPRIFQTVNLILRDKNRCRNQPRHQPLRRWIPRWQSADWLAVESAEVGPDSVTVISGTVWISMMRFHTTLEAAEGQRYDALQQGVPQQPKVPLLLYLPSS